MRKKKPFIIVFVAIVLSCSIPISASALGNWEFTSDFDYFTYGGAHRSTKGSPRVHMVYKMEDGGIDNELLACYHTGGCKKCFIIFIPVLGYYLVSIQENGLPIDVQDPNDPSHHGIFTIEKGKTQSSTSPDGYPVIQSYRSWYGDGYLTASHRGLFQDVFFGYYWIFVALNGVRQTNYPGGAQYTVTGLDTPSDEEYEALKNYLQQNSGQDKPLPGGSAAFEVLNGQGSEVPTTPDGSEVMTNEQGNPIPTYPDGSPAPTYPNGNPAPTYPDGSPAPTYPNGNAVPSTVYDGDFGSELNTEFSKLYSLVDDLDQASSIMESNAEIMSSHCDSTRTLLNDVIGWLPSSVVACLVCGCIMIIAVKITGSGKS